ncbi:MAG: hypothetical protein ABI650_03280 [Dokdonella sp.]
MKRLVVLMIMVTVMSSTAFAQSTPRETRYAREGGELILRTGETSYRPSGPAPSFAELDRNGDRTISADEANGYTLLANDFLKADGNHDGRIGSREYANWIAQP